MAYVRHEAALDKRDDKGVSLRATLELRAAQGSQQAIADLTPPDYPEHLAYLLGWSQELVGRSGVGMSGFAPLSWSELQAWARLTDRTPSPEECDALMALDAAFRNQEEPTSNEASDVAEPKAAVIKAWPAQHSKRAD